MDVVALEYAAGHIGDVVVARAQALEGRVLIVESGQERERELRRIEWLKGEV